MIGLHDIDRLAGGRLGTRDVLSPVCGLDRRSPLSQRRRVLRVWRIEPGKNREMRGNAKAERREAKRRRATLARC
jgi:hypothetical protein